MSVSVDQRREGPLPAPFPPSDDALSDLGDGSSSLSDIEDKEADPDGLEGVESENELETEPNDSEAETERLENSPHNQRKQKDVVVNSQAEITTYERSPSKLQNQYLVGVEDDDERETNDLSDDEVSLEKSLKSLGPDELEQDLLTATTSLVDSSGEGKGSVTQDTARKKRKRSLLPDRDPFDAPDADEPARKRTGSVGVHENDYAIDDSASINGDVNILNPISGNLSDVESVGQGDEEDENQQAVEDNVAEDISDTIGADDVLGTDAVPRKPRKKYRSPGNNDEGVEAEQVDDGNDDADVNRPANEASLVEEPEEIPDGDEAEVATRNEEEQEKKRAAMERLSEIERGFSSFRERLYEERLAQLDLEEAMLQQEKPTHPRYLAMMQCVDARRDERLRIERRWSELQMETIEKAAVAGRSQILTQFYQEVREIRESKLELLGKQWYEIQHDRRGYGTNVEDYAIKFPTRKSQQVMHQLAYNAEVSVLSGVAKYVGFPAAPKMASATAAEVGHDLEKMSKSQSKQQNQRMQQGLLLPDLAALRAATSTTGFKPAEEQFIEQTPWANPQHPSHAHVLQQALGQQPVRLSSPFSAALGAQVRRPSHQHSTGTPISGTFSTGMHSTQPLANGAYVTGGRKSPINPFANSSLAPKPTTPPLGGQQTSVSPLQARVHLGHPDNIQMQETPHEYLIGVTNSQSLANMPESQVTRPEFSSESAGRAERTRSKSMNGQL